jgi:hypothetical protein
MKFIFQVLSELEQLDEEARFENGLNSSFYWAHRWTWAQHKFLCEHIADPSFLSSSAHLLGTRGCDPEPIWKRHICQIIGLRIRGWAGTQLSWDVP